MLYGTIQYVDKPVSRILFGTAISPLISGGDGSALLDTAFSLGINGLDTARNYGLSEASIGNWLESRGNREKVVLISKCAHPSMFGRKRVNERDIRKDFKRSTELMRTNYIDIYLLHRDDPDVPTGEVVEILNAMHAEGKIGAFGGSNWTYIRIQQANEYAYAHNLIPFTVSSPNFSLAEQVEDPWGGGCVTISGPDHGEARAWYRRENMPVIAYSSLAHGLFSGRLKSSQSENAASILDAAAIRGYAYPANFERLRRCEELAHAKRVSVPQIALRWLFAQGLNAFAVVSASCAERMRANIEALSLPMTQAEADYLDLKTEVCYE